MARRETERTVTITARSFDSLAARFPLSFPVPYGETDGGECFEYTWHLIQYAFRLPDPRSFVAVSESLTAEDRRVLLRYVRAAQDMASSQFLRSPISINLSGPLSSPDVEVDFPSSESVRGFSVLFRQFFESKEGASFNAVQRVLRQANDRADDVHAGSRREILTAWARAVGQLRAQQLKVLVGRRLVADGRWQQAADDPFPGEHVSPQQLISRYNYGEDIHWGRHSKAVEALQKNPTTAAFERDLFFDALQGLACLFLGFSLAVESSLVSVQGDEQDRSTT